MPTESGRSPIVIFMSIAVIAIAIGGGFVGWDNYKRTQERKRIAAEELAAADRARADQIRSESAAQREVATGVTGERREKAIESAARQLASNHSGIQCDGALALGRLRATSEKGALESALEHSTSHAVRRCAAAGLVEMGETHTALVAYDRWARGNDRDMQRSALMGFGEIGAPALEIGMPYLREALRSPQMDLRYIAVESLSKMGPSAKPLLQLAAGDADARVRMRAAAALKASR